MISSARRMPYSLIEPKSMHVMRISHPFFRALANAFWDVMQHVISASGISFRRSLQTLASAIGLASAQIIFMLLSTPYSAQSVCTVYYVEEYTLRCVQKRNCPFDYFISNLQVFGSVSFSRTDTDSGCSAEAKRLPANRQSSVFYYAQSDQRRRTGTGSADAGRRGGDSGYSRLHFPNIRCPTVISAQLYCNMYSPLKALMASVFPDSRR